MLTLLSERFAPITSSIGFVQAPCEDVAGVMGSWLRELYPIVRRTDLGGSFPTMLSRLEPLVSGARPRELIIQTARRDCTAFFDCSLMGTDAVSFVGHICTLLKCEGLAIRAQPHTMGTGREVPGRYGAVQFELFGPEQTRFLNYVRTVSAAHDGSRWRFDTWGAVQPFERVEAYRSRRVRDRFTSSMLAAYCEAIGMRPFEASFYLPVGVLFESDVPMPPSPLLLSLQAAQERLGIVPGLADALPG